MKEKNEIKAAERQEDTFPYLFDQKARKETAKKGYVALGLLNEISSPKTDLSALFHIDPNQLTLWREDISYYIDERRGKPVLLNARDIKFIYGLAYALSKYKDDEDFLEYSRQINEGKKIRTSYLITLDITEFTKFLGVSGTARAREKEATIKELKRLADIRQFRLYDTDKGEKASVIAPLITIQGEIRDESAEKTQDIDQIVITLASSFFRLLSQRYAVLPPSLFKLWGKKGNGTDTELFGILLSDLLDKYIGRRAKAKSVSKRKRREDETEEQYIKAKEMEIQEALTYSENLSTIKEKVVTDYESTRKQKKQFIIDLEKSLVVLRDELRLITDYYPKDLSKADKVSVVFNADYHKYEESV